jgi:hypothetical protein
MGGMIPTRKNYSVHHTSNTDSSVEYDEDKFAQEQVSLETR